MGLKKIKDYSKSYLPAHQSPVKGYGCTCLVLLNRQFLLILKTINLQLNLRIKPRWVANNLVDIKIFILKYTDDLSQYNQNETSLKVIILQAGAQLCKQKY